MKIRPLGDRICVKRVDSSSETPSGIIIPDSVLGNSMEGVIVGVGPGSYDKHGIRNKMNVFEGQTVIFGQWAGEDLEIEGEDYVMLTEADIVGILKEKD